MQILLGKRIAVAAAIVVFGLTGSSWARVVRTHIHPSLRGTTRLKLHAAAITGEEVVPGVMPTELSSTETPVRALPESALPEGDLPESAVPGSAVPGAGKAYKLHMNNLHTGETLDIVYRIGNTYVPEALEKLNYFLRDRHTEDVVHYEPKEFDVLHALMSRLGRTNGVIDIVCGYRTPETNEALRHSSPRTGVAEHSQHMEGHAIDLRVPGVSTAQVRNTALSLHAGGVGYYPVSQFVHVDVGPVREWAFGVTPRRPGRRVHGSHSGSVTGE